METQHPNTAPLIAAHVHLDERYSLAEAVDSDGRTGFWIMDAQHDDGGTSVEFPEHERDGRLPTALQRRLGLECGAMSSTTGKPCRQLVKGFGQRCAHHQGKANAGQGTLFEQGPCG